MPAAGMIPPRGLPVFSIHAMVPATALEMLSVSVTSVWKNRAKELNSEAAVFPRVSLRSRMATLPPFWPIISTVALPRPEALFEGTWLVAGLFVGRFGCCIGDGG